MLFVVIAAVFAAGCAPESALPVLEETTAAEAPAPKAKNVDDANDERKQAEELDALGLKIEAADQFEGAAWTFNKLDHPDQAIACLGRAIHLWQFLGNAKKEARALNYRAHFLINGKGDRLRAEADYRNARELALRVGDKELQAEVNSNMGALLQRFGDFRGARQSYEDALDILTGTVGLEQRQVDNLRNLAHLSDIEGNLSGAELLLNRAHAIQIENGLPQHQILADLGWQMVLGHRDESALPLFNEALKQRPLSPKDESLFLDRLGTALSNLGRFDEARIAYRKALSKAREPKQPGAELGILTNLCILSVEEPEKSFFAPRVKSDCGELLDAIPYGDTNRQASAYYWQSRYLEHEGRMAEAIDAGKKSIELLEGMRSNLEGSNNRTNFLEDRSNYFRRLIALQMAAHRAHPQEGQDRRAIETSERLRARSLLELWAEPGSDKVRSSDQELLESRKSKLAELDRLEAQRNESGGKARLSQTINELDVVEHRLRQSSTGDSATQLPHLDLDALRGRLEGDTALVDVLLAEPRSHLWIIEKKGIRSFELPSGADLETAARDYLKLLADPRASSADAELWDSGHSLARLLFGEHQEKLKDLPPRLVFIGDGPLQSFPIAALPRLGSSFEDPRYLIDDFEVVHLPALSLLDPFYAPRPGALPTRPAIVLADTLHRNDGEPGGYQGLSEEDLARYFPQERPQFPLGRLRFADLEAELLEDRFAKLPVKFARGPEASKSLALSAETGQYSIVHFSSHGWQDPDQVELSGISFSEVDAAGKAVDGDLLLQDLYSLHWHAQLVVTSACQTGVGGHFRLEGVNGLAQGFFHIGARRALVSLWKVESQSTALLMDYFYLHLLTGQAPGAALRKAGLDLRRDAKRQRRPWNSPYYWAPFVLIGDWNAFEVPPGNAR